MFQQVMKIIILVFADMFCILLEMCLSQRRHFEKKHLSDTIWRAHTQDFQPTPPPFPISHHCIILNELSKRLRLSQLSAAEVWEKKECVRGSLRNDERKCLVMTTSTFSLSCSLPVPQMFSEASITPSWHLGKWLLK